MGQEDIEHQLVIPRKFDKEKDYEMLCDWWKVHGSYAPMQCHLPPTGVVTEIDGEPISAGFLFNTDARICVIEFIICNPKVSKEKRDKGLNNLILFLRDLALKIGYNAIYNSTGIPKFIGRLKEAGFIEADKNQTHMFYFDYEAEGNKK